MTVQFAPGLWGIPVVQSTVDRGVQFPTPLVNQRVHNLGTGLVERWTGTQWQVDVMGGDVVSVTTYGAVGDGSNDDTAALQAALTAAEGTNAIIFLPTGTYKITSTLDIPNGITVRGVNRASSIISNAGTGDALLISNPANGSGYGRTVLEDFAVTGTNAANVNAAIELQAGGFAYYSFRRLMLSGYHKYGLIIDQAEISWFDDLIIENGNTTDAATINLWIVNGADRRVGTSQDYSNVLAFSRLQLNNGVQGIVDDGGNIHSFTHGNLNGNSNPARFAGVTGLTVDTLSFETQLQTGTYNVLIDDRSLSGTNVGPVQGGTIKDCTFSGNMAASQAALRSTSSSSSVYHTGLHVAGNHFLTVLGRAGAIDLTKFGACRFGPNHDGSTDFHYVGAHQDAHANELTPAPANAADGTKYGVLSRPGVPTKLLGGMLVGDESTYGSGLMQLNAVLQGTAFIGGFTVTAGQTADVGQVTVTGADPTGGDFGLPPSPQTVTLGGLVTESTVDATDKCHGWVRNNTGSSITVASNTWLFRVVKAT